MKTINYRGMTFEVEDHFKYVATDADGSIYAYEHKPFADGDEWFNSGKDVKCLKVADEEWRDSLENI